MRQPDLQGPVPSRASSGQRLVSIFGSRVKRTRGELELALPVVEEALDGLHLEKRGRRLPAPSSPACWAAGSPASGAVDQGLWQPEPLTLLAGGGGPLGVGGSGHAWSSSSSWSWQS